MLFPIFFRSSNANINRNYQSLLVANRNENKNNLSQIASSSQSTSSIISRINMDQGGLSSQEVDTKNSERNREIERCCNTLDKMYRRGRCIKLTYSIMNILVSLGSLTHFIYSVILFNQGYDKFSDTLEPNPYGIHGIDPVACPDLSHSMARGDFFLLQSCADYVRELALFQNIVCSKVLEEFACSTPGAWSCYSLVMFIAIFLPLGMFWECRNENVMIPTVCMGKKELNDVEKYIPDYLKVVKDKRQMDTIKYRLNNPVSDDQKINYDDPHMLSSMPRNE